MVDLNRLELEAGEIQNSMIKKRNYDTSRLQMLQDNIKDIQREEQAGKGKLKKIDAMIKKFSRSIEWSDAVIDFKKEKVKAQQNLARIQKEVSSSEHEAHDLRQSLYDHQKQFSAKSKSIQEQIAHAHKSSIAKESVVREINNHLVSLKGSISNQKLLGKNVEKSKETAILNKHKVFTKKIDAISALISKEKEEHKKYTAQSKETSGAINGLTDKMPSLVESLLKSKNSMENLVKKILDVKSKHDGVKKEQRILQLLVRKIRLESKSKLAAFPEVLCYLEQLEEEILKDAAKEIEKLQRGVSSKKKDKLKLDEFVKKDRSKLFLSIEKKGAQQISELDKKIHQLESKIQTSKGRSSDKINEFEGKVKEKKRLFFLGRGKIHNEEQKLRSKKRQIAGKAKQTEKNITLLDQQLKSLNEGIIRRNSKVMLIENKLNTRDAHLKKLNEIIKEKHQYMDEARKMRAELKFLHMAIEDKVPAGKTKTRIIRKIQRITRIKKVPIIRTRTKTIIKTRRVPVTKVKQVTKHILQKDKTLAPTLKAIDGLLGKLPQKDIDNFSNSKQFGKYKDIMKKYGVR
jgi:hypothetical protein